MGFLHAAEQEVHVRKGHPGPVVSVDQVAVRLGGRTVLEDLTCAIEPGEFVGCIGSNGAGKSTLVRLLLGLIRPAAGSVSLFGDPVRRGNRRIGYVPQHASFREAMTLRARDMVALGIDGTHFGPLVPTAAKAERVERMLREVRALPYADAPIARLSGGELQRLMLAQALVGDPDLLLLDEPLAHLDLRSRREVVNLFTLVAALAMGILGERIEGRDVAIGIVLAFALGLGILFLQLYTAYASEAFSILFGTILGISRASVYTTLGIACAVIVGLGTVFRPLLFTSVNSVGAEAAGVPVRTLSALFLVLLALTVSEAVQVVGVLLIFALLIAPPATAMYLTPRVYPALGIAVGLGVLETWFGLVMAYYTNYSVSFYIASVAVTLYLLTRLLAWGGLVGHRSVRDQGGTDIADPNYPRNTVG